MPGRNDHDRPLTVKQFHEDLETLKHLDDIEVKPDDEVWDVTALILRRLHHHQNEQLQLIAATEAQKLLGRRPGASG